MSSSRDTSLAARLERQAELYDEVSKLIGGLSDRLQQEGETTQLLQQIAEYLGQAASLTADTSQISADSLTSIERRAATNVRLKLEGLMTQIQNTEALAAAARDRLLPQLNDQTKRRRMLNAYSGS